MTKHKVGTRKEWLAARLQLLDEEKALTRRGDEVTRKRLELPWVRVDKEYHFETDDGRASLPDLFRGRSQPSHLSLHVRTGFHRCLSSDVRKSLEAGKEGPLAEFAAGAGVD